MSSCDVSIHLSDIMTPRSFSSLVTTLIKYLMYEKQLIPYPYDRLKLYIKKYKELNFEVSWLLKFILAIMCNIYIIVELATARISVFAVL